MVAGRLRRLTAARLRIFVDAGFAALARTSLDGVWVQVGLEPARHRLPDLYASIAEFALSLRPLDFFFMHKPPGLRLRFLLPVDTPCTTVREQAAAWRSQGLITTVLPGVYEPEQHLFGGPDSMRHVHRLFTVDSQAWLAFHTASGDNGPAWAYSLSLLRHVLDGLGIAGWEDLDVWDRIARQTGRVLPAGLTPQKTNAVAGAFRAAWAQPGTIGLAQVWGPPLREAAQQWQRGYFGTDNAIIGPREGAAFATIFHWNRGGLSPAVQSMLTSALGDRAYRP